MSADAVAGIPTSAPVERALARAWRRLCACVRLDEVLVLQGTPLLGALFAMGRPTLDKVSTLALFAVGSCCLVAHVFVLNDWAGMSADLRDPHRALRVFAAEGVPSRAMGQVSVALLLLAVLWLSPFGARTVAIALAIAGLSALYSLHRHPAKGVPVLGSFLHLTGGVLHFHLGYLLFGPLGETSMALSAFFALTFAAGHVTQEVRDHDADLSNGIRTNAVAFGPTATFVAGLVLFVLADVLLVTLALCGVTPRVLVLVAPFFLWHLAWSLQTLRAGLTFENIRRLRRRYRELYVVVGLLMLAALFAH
jgi:4-hydroxybenzoate polyprenyltransferase